MCVVRLKQACTNIPALIDVLKQCEQRRLCCLVRLCAINLCHLVLMLSDELCL
jgi:hypothetical protein